MSSTRLDHPSGVRSSGTRALRLAVLLLLGGTALMSASVARSETGTDRDGVAVASSSAELTTFAAARRAIETLDRETALRMDTIRRHLALTPAGSARTRLEQSLDDLKFEYRIESLKIRARFARGRGDLLSAALAETLIVHLTAPRLHPQGLIHRDPPTEAKAPRTNGGRR